MNRSAPPLAFQHRYAMLIEDFDDSSHVWWGGLRELIGTP